MAVSAKNQWQKCLDLIHSKLNEQQYTMWFAPVRFKSFDQTTQQLTVCLPSLRYYEYLEGNFRRLIYQAIYSVFGVGTTLTYLVEVVKKDPVLETPDVEPDDVVNAPEKKRKKLPASDLDPCLNYEQTFQNFLEGPSNRLARSVGQSVADKPTSKTFNPLFIYGPSGCGKTHLVNAIGVRMRQLHPEKRVLYIPAHLFQVQFVDAKLNNKINDFIHFYQGIDCLILDDIQELSGKQKTIEAFFHIFNHLHLNGRQIVMTSDRTPSELQDMEERMLTRFKWGMTAELEAPDGQLRHDILEHLVRRDGLDIPQDVIDYVAQNVQDNIRELEGVVHSMLAYSVVGNTQIDVEFARRILKANTRRNRRRIMIEDVIEATCRHYQINYDQMTGSCRRQDYVIPRHVAMYLTHKLTGDTAKRIGTVMGGRSHATVLHAIKLVEDKITADAAFRKEVREVKKTI